MTKKNYQVGLLITGDAKKGIKATELTRDGLKKLSTQQKKTSKSTKDLKEKSGSLIGKLGKVTGVIGIATAAVAGMGAVMRTQAITELKVMADTLNLSTQTLSEWSVAGEKFNVQGDKMADIFKDLQDKIGDFAATGGGEAKDIFEKLNLDINEFAGLGADQQLLKIGAALDGVASHSEKIFYLEALANDASRLLPLLSDGAKGLKSAQEEARLLGTSINDIDAEMIAVAGREFQRTGDVVTGLGNVITAKLAPALGGMNSGIADIVVGFGGWETIIDDVIDFTLSGLGFVLDRLNTLYVFHLQAQLGWLMVGKAATSAMASSAEITADVINTVLEPFQALLWGIADGWGAILIGIGEFTGDAGITELGESLKSFAHDVSGFSVSADDIVAADKAMDAAITGTKAALVDAKNATRGADLKKAWDENTQAAKTNATATAKASKAQRELRQEAAAAKKALVGDDYKSEIDKMIEGADNLSSSWSSAGNVIIDTFGSVAQQLDQMSKSQRHYADELAKTAKLKIKYKDDPKELNKIAKLEENLAKTRTIANLSSYASIAGAAGDMFKENSKAAKVAHAIEQALNVATLAMSVEKMLMSATETGVVVANETIKQTALGTTAIITQGQGDPYTAWGRIAAMVALVAGLGIATSGGGSSAPPNSEQRQKNQGTGTVLGSDDKSASLLNAYARIESLELDQYAELQKMNSSLRDLNSNISNLAVSLVGSYGKFDEKSYQGDLSGSNFLDTSTGAFLRKIDPVAMIFDAIGLGGFADKVFSGFSKTKKTLIDSGISIVSQTLGEVIDSGILQAQAFFDVKTKKKKAFGLSSKTSYDTQFQGIDEALKHEFSLLFGSIGNSINAAVDVLGIDVTKSLDAFVINLPNISFKDLSGDEIQAELEAVFSQQADLMTTYLYPSIREFQQVGEGLFDTLVRVAQEQAIFNAQMDAIGHSIAGFGDITKEAEIAIAQSLIGLMGGIENFQQATALYFSEFFSEDEQFDYLEKQLGQMFDGLNQTLPNTREGLKTLIDGIDITTESGQALYSALLGMIGSLDQYYDTIEDGTGTIVDAVEKERELNAARQDFLLNMQDELARLDMSPLQIQLSDLMSKFNALRDEAQALGVSTVLLEKRYAKERQIIIDNALSAISRSHAQAVNDLVSNNKRLLDSFSSLSASIANAVLSIRRQGSNFNESDYQSGQINDFSALIGEGSVEEQISNIGNLEKAYTAKYDAELAQINANRDVAQSAYDNQLTQINDKYQLELDVYNSIRAALDSLKEAANSLLLSDFSTLTNEQKLNESKNQFESILARAKSGDVDALGQLSNSGNSYLTEAQGFYASGSDYQAIFDQVYGALNSLGSQSVSGPSRQSAPPVPREISNHNAAVQALQESTVEKLLELKDLTAELQAQTESEFDLAMISLEQQLITDTLAITSRIDTEILQLERIGSQLSGIGGTLNDIDKWQTPPIIIQVPPPQQFILPVPKAPDRTDDALVKELQLMNETLAKQKILSEQQAKLTNEKADRLALQLNQNARLTERRIDEQVA